ncbi:MAG: hypothetical protein DCF13_13260 [Flavobacteriaceae bacterium]|nr:MAG: hypothetical protein DCF13_13260 [Flavobacteriaceae bacterium]
MKKTIIAAIVTLASFNLSHSQEVEIKDDKVYLDGKELLRYEKVNVIQHSFYTLKDDEEILLYKEFDNETPKYVEDDYYILNFLQEKIKVETQDFSKIASFMNSKKAMQKLIKWLVKEKVITPEGTINRDKLDTFYEKYNENIVNRTMR